MAIRNCTNFDFEEGHDIHIQDKHGNNSGNLIKTGDTVIISNNAFSVFDCSYFKNIDDHIILEDGTTVEHYKKSTNFKLYYSSHAHLIFAAGSTNTTKKFLNDLVISVPDQVALAKFNFDFDSIRQSTALVKGVWFKVQDENVDSKAFFGDDVDQNDEVNIAIGNEDGTYLIVQMDVGAQERTIGFSKKSTIVIYNTIAPTPESPYPYLQIAFDIYSIIHDLV